MRKVIVGNDTDPKWVFGQKETDLEMCNFFYLKRDKNILYYGDFS
jgi:hypothetical protein